MNYALATRDWESIFQTWAQSPSKTEQEKCENAERAIRKAIDASSRLAGIDLRVFAQGSYRNRTNVRQDSDVDICVRCTNTFFYDLQDGITASELGFTGQASYQFAAYRNDIEQALRDHFGTTSVHRGNKAFDVHENTYRLDADVVAAFEYRLYYRNWNGIAHLSGTKFITDSGGEVINWPQQHYDNGVTKNDATAKRFKAIVRVLKRVRNEMAAKDIHVAKATGSFFIESLVWNVPNQQFGSNALRSDVRGVLAHIFNETLAADRCQKWFEVNGIKYLFHQTQPWTQQDAHAFADAAWNYIGLQ